MAALAPTPGPAAGPVRLIAYKLVDDAPPIQPAPAQREWMDVTSERFAYRCLPLVIANMHGWQILSPAAFSAEWDGRGSKEGIQIEFRDHFTLKVQSHFGSGVLTFLPGYLFRTSPGYNLWVKGPTNGAKPGLEALEGIVETDWSNAPFTMNWRFQRPGMRVHFRRGEPICTVFPIPRGLIESVQPEVRELHDDPELAEAYAAWQGSRTSFISDLRKPDPNAAKEARWQKDYFRGTAADGERFAEHQTKLHLKPFAARGADSPQE
jgi:hypothetical protein